MDKLSDRLEQAEAGEQRELLLEAFAAAFPKPFRGHYEPLPEHSEWVGRRLVFIRKLDAEAFESAALSLVPEGWRLGNLATDDPKDGGSTAHLVRIGAGYGANPDDRRWATATTPALAICAAALRAKGL